MDNNYKSKVDRPKAEKVISGKVTVKKKSHLERLFGGFIAEDLSTVAQWVLLEKIRPGIKDLVYNSANEFLRRAFYPNGGGGRMTRDEPSYNYSRCYRPQTNRTASRTSSYDFGQIVFKTQDDAENLLRSMQDYIREYGMISVGNLYDMIDETCNSTDWNYGWTSLRTAHVVRAHNGWSIDFPPTMKIEY